MRLSPVIALVVLLPVSASAEEFRDTPEGAIPIDPPGSSAPSSLDAPPHTQHLGDKIMFVNFDGADMNGCGNDDPHNNCSTIWGGIVEPYSGDAAKRATVIQVVRSRTEDFGITVTDTRPASGDYDMEMVGNWQGYPNPDFAGIAPSIDCFDQWGGETSFTLEAGVGTSDGMAEIILQEIAHTWGLEHINDQGDLLYPTTQGQGKVFKDECLKIVSDTDLNPSGGRCNSMHTMFCSSGWQNSYRELLTLFGPAIPDTSAPIIQIVSPAEGATVDGGDVTLVVHFEDNLSPVIINATITVEGTNIDPVEDDGAYAGPSELEFPITGLPDGEYTITIEGTDESDNPAGDAVSFTVVGNPSPDGGDGGDSGADGGESGGADDGGSGDPDEEDGGNEDDEDSGDDDGSAVDGGTVPERGCACRFAPTEPLHLAFFGLLSFAAIRRRRSAKF